MEKVTNTIKIRLRASLVTVFESYYENRFLCFQKKKKSIWELNSNRSIELIKKFFRINKIKNMFESYLLF